MTKPVLLTVDDDAEALRAMERDLRRPYASTYRVLRAETGMDQLNRQCDRGDGRRRQAQGANQAGAG
jgi:hypothetical protein